MVSNEVLDILELDEAHVLLTTNQRLVARGIEMQQFVAHLATIEHGKCVRWEMFLSEQEAREAASRG